MQAEILKWYAPQEKMPKFTDCCFYGVMVILKGETHPRYVQWTGKNFRDEAVGNPSIYRNVTNEVRLWSEMPNGPENTQEV
jgi:hypothetical protein